MAAEDSELFTKRIRVENKILFVDVRQNSTGMYLKLSEKRGMKRNSIIIPASGISDLHETLAEALAVASPKETTTKKVAASPAPQPAKSVPQPAKSTLPANSVKVVNLSFSTTEEGLANHFGSAGKVVKATIILRKSKDKEISSGRGIVEFADAAGVAKAQTLHESELDGRKIAVQGGKREEKTPAAATTTAAAAPAPKAAKVPGGPAPDKIASPTKVFVTNLSWDTTDNDLETYFSRIGAVKSAIVKKSKSGRSFGQGIVEFVADSDTAEAIDRLNNTELDGRSITIRPFYESSESA